MVRPRDDEEDGREHHIAVPTMLSHLPLKTRLWLADKREADLECLDDMIEMQKTIRSLGRMTKWLFFALIGMIVALGEMGQALTRFFSYFTGWAK